jgi:hypothetical protein
MSNYFVKFFDAIQDRIARHEIEEEIKLDKLFGKNKLAGKTVFEGIVMSDPAATGGEISSESTANRFKAIKVYIKEIDDHMFDFDLLNNETDNAKKEQLLNNLIGGCYTAYPDSSFVVTGDIKFEAGSTVQLMFSQQGPQTSDHGRMRGLRYTKVIRASNSRYSSFAKYFGGNSSDSFGTEASGLSLTGDYEVRSSRTIEDLLPDAKNVIQDFMNDYKEKTGIVLTPTSVLRTYGTQVSIEHNNVQNNGGAEWYRKTYRTSTARTKMLDNYLNYPNDREGNIQRNVPILKEAGLGSAHMKGLGIDFSTIVLNYDQGVKLEDLAQEYKKAGKFSSFEWELVSKKYASNREQRKQHDTKFSGEHMHISIHPDAKGQI